MNSDLRKTILANKREIRRDTEALGASKPTDTALRINTRYGKLAYKLGVNRAELPSFVAKRALSLQSFIIWAFETYSDPEIDSDVIFLNEPGFLLIEIGPKIQ